MACKQIHRESDQKKSMNRLIMELVHELGKMSIEDLEEFRPELIKNLREEGSTEPAIYFLNKAIDLVIEKKQEKRRETV